MDIGSAKSKLGEVVKKAKTVTQDAVANGKTKFDEAGGIVGLKAKALATAAEIKANFKADEGATGARKFLSMFTNLWTSGTAGKTALVASSAVLLLLLAAVSRDGDGNGAQRNGKTTKANNTFAIKGLSIGMSGDDAVEACKKIVGNSKDIAVIDFRNGYARKKDEATLAKEKAAYDENVAAAQKDVDTFFGWYEYGNHGFDPMQRNCVDEKSYVDKVGLFVEPEKEPILEGRFLGRNYAVIKMAAHFKYLVEWMIPVMKKAGPNERPKAYVGKCDAEKFNGSFTHHVADKELFAKRLRRYEPNGRERVYFRLPRQDKNGKEVNKDEIYRQCLESERRWNSSRLRKPDPRDWKEVARYKQALKDFKDKFEGYWNWVTFDSHSLLVTTNGVPDFDAEGKPVRIFDSDMRRLAKSNNLEIEWMVPVLTGGVDCVTVTLSVDKKDLEKGRYLEDMASVNEGTRLYEVVKEKGLEKPWKTDRFKAWFRLAEKDANGVAVSKEKVVREWLVARGVTPPSDMFTLPKKNCIDICLRNNKRTEDKWGVLCSVWIDNKGNVQKVYFPRLGLEKLFNAKTISSAELADLLVKNYKGIPNLNKTVKTECETRDGSVAMKTFTWFYRGSDYEVKLLDCDFFDQNDQKIDLRADYGLAMALQANKQCDRYLVITAVDPASVPKFD